MSLPNLLPERQPLVEQQDVVFSPSWIVFLMIMILVFNGLFYS